MHAARVSVWMVVGLLAAGAGLALLTTSWLLPAPPPCAASLASPRHPRQVRGGPVGRAPSASGYQHHDTQPAGATAATDDDGDDGDDGRSEPASDSREEEWAWTPPDDGQHPLLSAARWAPLTRETNLVLFVLGGEGTGHHAVLPILRALLLDAGLHYESRPEDDLAVGNRQQGGQTTYVGLYPSTSGVQVAYSTISYPWRSVRCHPHFSSAGLDGSQGASEPGSAAEVAATLEAIRVCRAGGPSESGIPISVKPDTEERPRITTRFDRPYDLLGQMEDALAAMPAGEPRQVRVLVLTRGFEAQAASHGKAEWLRNGETPVYHAQVCAWFDRLIGHDVSQGLHPSLYRVGHYERLLSNCTAWVEELAGFLAMPLETGLRRVRKLCMHMMSGIPKPRRVSTGAGELPAGAAALLAQARAAGDWTIFDDERHALV